MAPFIQDLIDTRNAKKAQSASDKSEEDQFNAQALQSLLGDEGADPSAKGWAMHTLLTKYGGLNDEASGHVLNLVKGISDMADQGEQQQTQGGSGGAPPDSSITVTTPPPAPVDTTTTAVASPTAGWPKVDDTMPLGTAIGGPTSLQVPAAPPLIDHSQEAAPTHPVRNALLSILAGGLSGGQTVQEQYRKEEAQRQNDLMIQRQKAESLQREQEQIRAEKRAPGNAAAMIPIEAQRAAAMIPIDVQRQAALRPGLLEDMRQEAILRARYQLPPTPPALYDENGPVPARYVLDASDPANPKWNLTPIQIAPPGQGSAQGSAPGTSGSLSVGAKPEFKIVGDPKSGPYAIQLPNGRVVDPTDPNVPPRAKQEFDMAVKAHKQGIEEESTLNLKNAINSYIALGYPEPEARRMAAQDFINEQKAKGTVRSEAQTTREMTNENRLRDSALKRLDAEDKLIEPHRQSLQNAKDTIEAGGSVSDSVLAPMLLKTLVGGGGVRITQAEISQVANSTTHPEQFKVAINKWIADPKNFEAVPPIVKEQATRLINLALDKSNKKKQALQDTEDLLNSTHSQQGSDFNSHITNLKKKLISIDRGQVRVQVPGHPPGMIDADKLPQFLKDNPGATELR